MAPGANGVIAVLLADRERNIGHATAPLAEVVVPGPPASPVTTGIAVFLMAVAVLPILPVATQPMEQTTAGVGAR